MSKKSFGFNYDLTFREFLYLNFKNKNCPHCNAKMKEEKTSYFGDWDNRTLGGNTKCYVYKYYCPNCKTLYTLSELAKNKPKKKISPLKLSLICLIIWLIITLMGRM